MLLTQYIVDYIIYLVVITLEIFHRILTNSMDKTSDKYITVNSFGYYKNTEKKIETLREHGRGDYQIIYIDKGNAIFEIDNQQIPIKSGNIILYKPGEKQKYYLDPNSDYYWVHFAGTGVWELLKELNLTKSIFETGDFFGFKEIFGKMIKDNSVDDIATKTLLSAHLTTILSLTSRKIYTEDSIIHKVTEIMQTDFANNYTNEDYAKICRLSLYHFIRRFKKETGFTPLQYKTKIIIEKATNLLSNTNLNITEIAQILGFEDSLYFSRVFKKEMGIAPREYMKNRKPLP